MDVARKAVILARESGLDLELGDIEVQSLVPEALEGAPVDEFLERLADFDAPNISLPDNIVKFVTRRYSDNPLIIRGPGAGPDVTAAGIFADLLRLCSMLSGHDD